MPETVTFPALDGRVLTGTVVEAASPKVAVITFGALGVPHRYYARFGAWMADHGANVLAFDYRGVAASRDRPLPEDPATILDWGRLDCPGAVEWARRRWPNLPLAGVGHSFGGQSFGLNGRVLDLDRLVVIGAGAGDFRYYPLKDRLAFSVALGATPLVSKVLGYVPGRLGLGEDLPAGVVRQWTRWCFTHGYLSGAPEVGDTHYARFTGPALFLDLPGDTYAPERPAAVLRSWFTAAKVTHRHVLAEGLPPAARGHFGAFRAGGEPIWGEIFGFVGG